MLRIFRYLLALALVLAASLSSVRAQEDGPLSIRVGAYDNRPKIYPTGGNGYGGVFPDILNVIADRENWRIEWIPGTWSQCLERLERGEIDLMVDVAWSEERAKRFDFNSETVLVNWGVVYSRSDLEVDSILALQDRRVAVMKGSIHTDGEEGIVALLDRFGVRCTLVEVDSYEEVFRLLEEGKADAGIVNRIFGALFQEQYNVKASSIVFNPRQIRFAFPKGAELNRRLATRIDFHLRRMAQDPDSILHRSLAVHLSGQSLQSRDSGADPVVELTDGERSWIREHPVIRLGVDPEFVPFEFLDQNGRYSGIASAYIDLLSDRLGLTLVVMDGLSWNEVVEGVREGMVDVLPCVSMTRERTEFLRFSRPYLRFQRVIIARDDVPFISGVEDLDGLGIAVQEGSSHAGFLREHGGLAFQEYPTLQEALSALSGGEADVLVGNLASSSYWIREMGLSNLRVAAPLSAGEQQLHLAVRQDWPELVRILNKGLASITPEEEQAILQQWIKLEYAKEVTPEIIHKYVLRGIAVGLPFVWLMIVWIWSLKRQIRRRREVEERLAARVELEHLLSGLSSRFASLYPGEIVENIPLALQEVAEHLGVRHGFLYDFSLDQGGDAHVWSAEGDAALPVWMEPLRENGHWVEPLREGDCPLVLAGDDVGLRVRACGGDEGDCPLDGPVTSRHPAEDVCCGAFLVLPRVFHNHNVGILGFGSPGSERQWRSDEIAMLRFVGQILTASLVRKDVDEHLRRSSMELARSNKRLKELDQLKSMFIASMSHELRTPLNSIIGFTGVLLQGMSGDLNDRQRDQLGRAHKSARHLLAMITDIIDISKIEAGRVDVHVERFPLSDVMDEAVGSIRHDLDVKGLDLKLELASGIVMNTDRKRLLQCVLNFLSNAVKYSEHGLITVRATRDGGTVTIDVQDTGIGIAEEDMERLFEPFERMESHLKVKAGGTGLGLYLTRCLVSRVLGGDVHVHSEEGRGSVFGLSVPMDISRPVSEDEPEVV